MGQQGRKTKPTTVRTTQTSGKPRVNLNFLTQSDQRTKVTGGNLASEKTKNLPSNLFLQEISKSKEDDGNKYHTRIQKLDKQPSFLLRLFDSLEHMEQSVYTQELLLEKQRKQQSLARPQSLQSPDFGHNTLYNLQTLF